MKNIMYLRIVLTALAMEFIYGLYIGVIRWYEPNSLTSVVALGFLMVTGGFLLGGKVNSNHLIQGALVGLVGVFFTSLSLQ